MARGLSNRIHNQRQVMTQPSRWIPILMMTLVLSACSGQDSETETAPEPLPAPPPPSVRSSSAGPAPDPTDPSNPASTAPTGDGSPEALQQARAERERLRGRMPRESLHWDEQAMREKLGIDADQFQTLQRARQTLLQERVSVRTGLQAQRHFQAEAAADSDRLAEIEDRKRTLHAQMEAAEQAWQETLHSVLDADQLQRWSEQP